MANRYGIQHTAPGAFGGGSPRSFTEPERNVICAYLVSIEQRAALTPGFEASRDEVLRTGAEQLAVLLGKSVDAIYFAFADENLCLGWLARLPKAPVVAAAPEAIAFTAAGYPVADADLHRCMEYYYEGGTMTVAEIRNRIDTEDGRLLHTRTRKSDAQPKSCDAYRASGTHVWTSRVLGIDFTYDPATKTVQLQAGYVAVPGEAVAAQDGAL